MKDVDYYIRINTTQSSSHKMIREHFNLKYSYRRTTFLLAAASELTSNAFINMNQTNKLWPDFIHRDPPIFSFPKPI